MKRIGVILGSVLLVLYILFLIIPFIVSPILNSYNSQISSILSDVSGINVNLKNVSLITTPKLTVGIKIGSIDSEIPSGGKLLVADDVSAKISLLPLILRKIELDSICVNNLNLDLKFRQDGHLLLEEYLPKPDPDSDSTSQSSQALPFGFKLSNNLPNIIVNKYQINLINMLSKDVYSLKGSNNSVSDFVFNKKVKLALLGSFDINSKEMISFDIKLSNKLMPNTDFNDLIFTNNSVQNQEVNNNAQFFNVLPILNAIKSLGITSNVYANINTAGSFKDPEVYGNLNVSNLSFIVNGKYLPKSYIKLLAKRNKFFLDTNLYSSDNELTTVNGEFSGNANTKLKVKSNTDLNSLVGIVNSFASAFGINDLKTLSANGKIDANFDLIASKKKINSSGYLKLPLGNINYKLYGVSIDNINADVDFNNQLNVKNISFNIFGQPLKIYGTVQQDSNTDLHVVAENLLVKGLLVAAGQASLLKDNNFDSGTLSLNASLKGKFVALKPNLNLFINNLKIKNIPSTTTLVLPSAKFALTPDTKSFKGNFIIENFQLINPFAKVTLPTAEIYINEKDIQIVESYFLFNNSRVNYGGVITDYLSNKLKLDIKAEGSVFANDISSMLPKELKVSAMGKLPVSASVKGDLTSQVLNLKINADKTNFVNLLDIDLLKGKNTLINLSARIIDDAIKLSDTGIFVNSVQNPIVSVGGSINNLSSNQLLNLHLSIPKTVSMPIPTLQNSNMTLRGNLNIGGSASNPILKGVVTLPDISIPDMAFKIANTVINLNGPLLKGNGTVQKIQLGGIIAENLAAEILLKNYSVLYLNNILGDAFGGKISGNISYNLLNGNIGVNATGSNMNALKTLEGVAGIKNALSGVLGFNVSITTSGYTDVDIIKNLKGNINFKISDGKFLNVGRFDSLLYAENILGNAILKTLVTSVTDLPIIQNTAEFKYIDGAISLLNGWANLQYIKTSGPLMAYFINGKYNILNATTNVIILGRLEDKVVMVLGPLGELSVDTLTSFIPKFGTLTSFLVRSFTSDPNNERVSDIPQLSSGSKTYKDFKVVFNGGIDSKSAVKSFKWLSKGDTSAIDLKQELKDVSTGIKNSIDGVKQEFIDSKNILKNSIQESKQQFNDAKNELKKMFSF